jgi:hypothetical protein
MEGAYATPPLLEVVDVEPQFHVEKLRVHRLQKRETEFLDNWKGTPACNVHAEI